MDIRRAHIDRFGILANQNIADLSPGLCLFLGRNEAGKSTSMLFFQAMLFGYKRGNRSLDPLGTKDIANLTGGSLFLNTQKCGPLTLIRRPYEKKGQAEIFQESGSLLTEEKLLSVFGGVSPDVFDNVFALTLRNLMDVSSLNGPAVKHALYAAAFGPGLRSPFEVLKDLDTGASALLKANRPNVKALINNTLADLEEISEALHNQESDTEAFAKAQLSMSDYEERLSALHKEEQKLLEQKKTLEQISLGWDVYQDLQIAKAELRQQIEGLSAPQEPIPFTSENLNKLHSLDVLRQEKNTRVEQLKETIEATSQQHKSTNQSAWADACWETLDALNAQRELRRSELESLAERSEELESLATRQHNGLRRLGPNWNPETVAKADTSEQTFNAIATHQSALTESAPGLAEQLAENKELQKQFQEATSALTNVEGELSKKIPPYALPSDTDLQQLATSFFHAADGLEVLLARQEQWQEVSEELNDITTNLGGAWMQKHLAATPLTPQKQEQLQEIGAALVESQQQLEVSLQTGQMAKEEQESAEAAVTAAQQGIETLSTLGTQEELEQDKQKLDELSRLLIRHEALAETLNNTLIQKTGGDKAPRKPFITKKLLHTAFCASAFLALICLVAVYVTANTFFLHTGTGCLVLSAIGFIAWHFLPEQTAEAEISRNQPSLTPQEAEHLQELKEITKLRQALQNWLPSGDTQLTEEDCRKGQKKLEAALEQLRLHSAAAEKLTSAQENLQIKTERLNDILEKAEAVREAVKEHTTSWHKQLQELSLPADTPPLKLGQVLQQLNEVSYLKRQLQELQHTCAHLLQSYVTCLEQAQKITDSSPILAKRFASLHMTPGLDQALVHTPERYPAEPLQRVIAQVEEMIEFLNTAKEQDKDTAALLSLHAERQAQRAKIHQRLQESQQRLAAASHMSSNARAAWGQWLQNYGLPVALSPADALEVVKHLKAMQTGETELRQAFEQHCNLVKNIEDYIARIRSLSQDVGNETPDWPVSTSLNNNQGSLFLGPDLAASMQKIQQHLPLALELLTRLTSLAEEQKTLQERTYGLDKRLVELQKELSAEQDALASTQQTISELLQKSGSASIETFQEQYALYTEHKRKEEVALQKLAAIGQPLQLTAEAILARFETTDKEQLTEELQLVESSLEENQLQRNATNEERGALRSTILALQEADTTAPLLQQKAILEEQLQAYIRQWSTYALARHILLTGKQLFEQEGQQGVIGKASQLFQRITQGEYTGISAGESEDSFAAIHKNGEHRNPENQLSQGTKEQLYLALRLAYIYNHARHAETMPVFMDDILVNADPERAEQTALILAEFAHTNQLFFFTCHPRTAELMADAAAKVAVTQSPPPAFYSITKGHIAKEASL